MDVKFNENRIDMDLVWRNNKSYAMFYASGYTPRRRRKRRRAGTSQTRSRERLRQILSEHKNRNDTLDVTQHYQNIGVYDLTFEQTMMLHNKPTEIVI